MKKYLKLMADYSSSGIWREDGCNVEHDFAPISESLSLAIKCWCAIYETNDDWREPEERTSNFSSKYFSNLGLEIAKQLKKELHDWTIFYFDEYQASKFLRIDEKKYLYEIT